MELTITQNTVLKPSTDQASTLDTLELAPVTKGRVLPVLAYREEQGHLCITLNPEKIDLPALHQSGKNTWWVFAEHIEDPAGFSQGNNPKDEPVTPPSQGFRFQLPGFKGNYWSNSQISALAPNFTWGEALKFDAAGNYRKPDNAQQVNNIIRAANGMQRIREKLGNRPIRITSWLRPYAINKAVGGASQSRHIVGDGVDFAVQGMTPAQVYAALDSWHGGTGGLAQGGRMGFVHVDFRGVPARWTYPGA